MPIYTYPSDREKSLPSLPPYHPHTTAPPLHGPLYAASRSQRRDTLSPSPSPPPRSPRPREDPRKHTTSPYRHDAPFSDLRKHTPSPLGQDAPFTPFSGCVTYYERSTSSSTIEHTRQKHSVRHLLATWWLEGLSILVMAVALAAIVATLRVHEDEPLPEWKGVYGFLRNINALLSIYYTVFKGAMLLVVEEGISQLKWAWFQRPRPLWDLERFNEASRGPKGAVQLLWASRSRLKSSLLPMVGSLLVISALLIDPFTQQIVHYYTCPRISATDRASVPRTNNFTSTSVILGLSGFGGTGDIKKDMGIQGAIYNGLFDSAANDPAFVPASCPTGNCTFDPYWSLGMCASLTDETLQVDHDCQPYEWWNERSLGAYNKDAPLCNYTLPAPQTDSPHPPLSLDTPPSPYGWIAFNMTPGAVIYSAQHPGMIAFQVLSWSTPSKSLPFSGLGKQLPQQAQGVGAVYAQLYPCIRQYEATVKGGVFEERSVSSMPFVSNDAVGWNAFGIAGAITIRVPCLSPDERRMLIQAGHKLVSTNDWIALSTTNFAKLPDHLNEECVFSMIGDFLEYSQQIFGNLWATGSFAGQATGRDQAVAHNLMGDQFQTIAAVEAFYDYGNVTFVSLSVRFTAIADALTSYMRRNPGDVPAAARTPALGTVWRSDTCVGVDWDWILLPASLFLLTSLYLLIVLASLLRGGCQNWKSSSMALMYNGLDADLSRGLSDSENLKEMEKMAKGLHVQLRSTGAGWRFVKSIDTG